jgi:hypothetical protein
MSEKTRKRARKRENERESESEKEKVKKGVLGIKSEVEENNYLVGAIVPRMPI